LKSRPDFSARISGSDPPWSPAFVDVGDSRIEYIRIAGAGPQVVLLHEGLGSVAMWRDFPEALAGAAGAEVVVYSRRGYGRSSPLTAPRRADYMHVEAREVLPAFLKALDIKQPVLLAIATARRSR